MTNLLQDIDLLHYFLLAVVVLQECLVDRFYRHVPSCQLMNTKGHFSESTLSDELGILIELERSRWHVTMLLYVKLVVFDELLALTHDVLIDSVLVLVGDQVVDDLLCCALG